MSAILREKDEAAVLTNETIEVHLSYLRIGFDAMQAALPVLRDKIDQLSAKVDSKVEALSEKLNAKIDAVAAALVAQIKETNARTESRIDPQLASLSERIDRANQERAAGDAALGQKIDNLSAQMSELREGVAELRGHMKTLVLVLSGGTVIGLAVWIAKTLNWI